MEKIMCGNGAVFYADCKSNSHIRELLLQFRLDPSSSNAEALLDDDGVRKYCDSLSYKCPSKCSCFQSTLQKRIENLKTAEKRPGGLCAVALCEKAALIVFKHW